MTLRPIIKGVRQVGLVAPDPGKLAGFYRMTFGLRVIGQGELNAEGVRKSVLLSDRSGADHHQVMIYTDPTNRYVGFEAESLTDLQTYYQRVDELGLPIRWTLNHGISLAFYFDDPADNPIKLFWPTGEHYPQPHGHPIDLTLSEAALRQDVANLMAGLKRLGVEET